jgi:glutathione synthase
MRTLFVMDPLDVIDVNGDSTYMLMRECTDRGWTVAMCTPDDLFAINGVGHAHVTLVPTTAIAPFFHPEAPVDEELAAYDIIWMRKDPPFDMSYIFATYLLDMAPDTTLVVNHPLGLKQFNEKLWAMAFADIHPPTLLTNNTKRLKNFVNEADGKCVLKPWDGNGGRGIVVTQKGDRNLGSVIDLLTASGKDAVIAQHYLPAIAQGDKRILLFDGEPVGAVMRVPGADDHRGNMHVGATVERTELNAADRHIVAVLRPHLKKHGLLFVGIDVIGDKLTEINITSPTGIQEITRLDGVCLEADLIDRATAALAALRENR